MSWRLYAIGHLLSALLLLAGPAYGKPRIVKPTVSSTSCEEDPLALNKAEGVGDTAFAACRHFISKDNAAKDAEKAADADDAANLAAKKASDKSAAVADDAKAAKRPLRKKADAARAVADSAKKTKDEALKAANNAISHLKCPENKDKFSKTLKDACP